MSDSPEDVVVVPPAEVGLLLLRGKGWRKRWRSSSGSGGGGGGGGRGRARDSGTAGGGGGEGAEAEGGVRSGKAKNLHLRNVNMRKIIPKQVRYAKYTPHKNR